MKYKIDDLFKLVPEAKQWINEPEGSEVDVDDAIFDPHLAFIQKQHPEFDQEMLKARAVYRSLTLNKKQPSNFKHIATTEGKVGVLLEQHLEEMRNQNEWRHTLRTQYREELDFRERIEAGYLDIRKDLSLLHDDFQAVKMETKLGAEIITSSHSAIRESIMQYITNQLCQIEATRVEREKKRMPRWAIILWMVITTLLLYVTAVRSEPLQQNVRPAVVLAACAGETKSAGTAQFLTIDTNGQLCLGSVGITGIVTINTSGLATSANQIIALPAGTAIIGKVGIDQTTPGTTNGVYATTSSCSGSTCYTSPVNSGVTTIASGSTSTIFASTTAIAEGSFCNNITASTVTLTATDGSNNPFLGTTTFGTSFSIPPLSRISFSDMVGSIFVSGIRMSASVASSITCWIRGLQ